MVLEETSYDGLIYDSAVGGGIWTHKFENGKHTWTLNKALEPGEIIGLTLIFNTTAKGNFTNFVSAGSNQTEVLTANATVNVLKPEFKVEKIVLTPKVTLGEQVRYEIVVHNTGETELHNITITELSFDGLVYDSFMDYDLQRYILGLNPIVMDAQTYATYDVINEANISYHSDAIGHDRRRTLLPSDSVA